MEKLTEEEQPDETDGKKKALTQPERDRKGLSLT